MVKLLLKALALREVKRQGEKLYLKALNATRKGIRYSFFLIVMSQVLLCGMGLSLYAAFQIVPFDEATKAYWMLGVGMTLFWVPLIIVLWGTSKSVWLKNHSGDY